MSDSTNDTSAIDEKKGSSNGDKKDFMTKVISFLKSVAVVILLVLIYFSSSALILYMCKLAQANILPTDINCAPYTDSKPNISPSPIKTNIFTTNTDPETSMKIEVPYDDYNSRNTMIDILKQAKDSIGSNPIGFLTSYFISIIESSIQLNYYFVSPIMNLINESFPETFIVLFGPIILGIISCLILVFNVIYFIYLWFTNMYWFFRTNKSSGDGKAKWEGLSMFNPFDWFKLFMGFILAIIFTVLFFIHIPIVIFIPVLIQGLVMFSLIFYKGKFKGKNSNGFSVIPELLKHYKITITTILSIFVVLMSFSKLGTIGGVSSILSVLLIYAGIVAIDLYKPQADLHQTPIVSYTQAKKTCSNKGTSSGGNHGWLYNSVMGQSGGGLTREIKKVGKKLTEL